MKPLTILALFAASLSSPSVVKAANQPPTSAQYQDCTRVVAPAYVSMARAAGYSDPYDLGAFYSEGVGRCLAGYGWGELEAQLSAQALYCDAASQYGASFAECDAMRAEQLAERAP